MIKSRGQKRKPRRAGFLRQYFRMLRFYLVTGLMVWIPLIVTVWLTWWLVKNVGVGVENIIERGYTALNSVGDRFPFLSFLVSFEYRPGYGFLIAVALFLITGFFTRNLAGRRFIRIGERILERIPLISRVYGAVRQIRDVFVRRDGTIFQEVCVIEYPRKGIFAVGFVTSRDQGVVQESVDREMLSIFVPTTPNPTSGFLLYLSAEEVTVLDITVEDAMKLIISGGAYLPGTEGEQEDILESAGISIEP